MMRSGTGGGYPSLDHRCDCLANYFASDWNQARMAGGLIVLP